MGVFDYEEDLSEDWVSQPRSSAPATIKGDSSALQGLANHAPQSKIPRPTAQPATPSDSPRSPLLKGTLSKINSGPGGPLNDTSASDLNTAGQRQSTIAIVISRQPPQPLKGATGSRRVSTSCLPFSQPGTVQHKAYDINGDVLATHTSTPEWKKRVLDGKSNAVQKPDLFSPMKLEHVFRPPTIRNKPNLEQLEPQERTSEKPKSKDPEYFPSSPPPYLPENYNFSIVTSSPQAATPPLSQGYQNLSARDGKSSKALHQSQPDAQDRIPSTNSETRHEVISPVLITNHESIQRHLRGPHFNQHRPLAQVGEPSLDARSNVSFDDIAELPSQHVSENTSYSLPNDRSSGLEAFATSGGFVTTRKGGCSSENSFHRRPLSSLSFRPSDAVIQSSAFGVIGRESNPFHDPEPTNLMQSPTTPSNKGVQERQSPNQPRSSGSPLKLFEKYDTFTNDRLTRRMSQFEGSYLSSPSQNNSSNESYQRSPSRRMPHRIRNEKHRSASDSQQRNGVRRTSNSFGEGSLNNFRFSQRYQVGNMDIEHDGLGDAQGAEGLFSISRQLMKARSDLPASASSTALSNGRRAGERSQSPNTSRSFHPTSERGSESDQRERIEDIGRRDTAQITEGKRSLKSPTKNPNPKRRRTIYETDDLRKTLVHETSKGKTPTKSIVGRKRKDARYENSNRMADPDTIATRRMLQPRIPQAGNARASPLAPADVLDKARSSSLTVAKRVSDREVLNWDPPHIDGPTQILAGELAHFALDVAQDITVGDRKASVTIADFFKDANLIMQNIRALAESTIAQTSGESSEVGHLANIEESSNEGSTKEEFSRPPSRAGGTFRALQQLKPVDPRVISHLRKFEEIDNIPLSLSSSMKSFRATQEDPPIGLEDIESDPPNVRVRQAYQTSDANNENLEGKSLSSSSADPCSQRSHPSNPSTGRSLPTGSSNGSGNKTVIDPKTVSHLISDTIGGMTFDHTKKIWVKRKVSKSTNHSDIRIMDSDATEEDPLRDIPDLVVDNDEDRGKAKARHGALRPVASRIMEPHTQTSQPVSASYGPPMQHTHNMSGAEVDISAISKQSKFSRLASSVPRPDTRATSWGDEIQSTKTHTNRPELVSHPGISELGGDRAEEAEHEASIFNGRQSRTPVHSRQARVVTVAFSSPLVNGNCELRGNDGEKRTNYSEDGSDLDLSDSPRQLPQLQRLHKTRHSLDNFTSRSTYRYNRRISIGNQNYVARPISRIDESDECAIIHPVDSCSRSMEVAISTPKPLSELHGDLSMPLPGADKNSSVMFHLSPLPEFTMHEVDESLNLAVDYISKSRGLLSNQEVEGKYSLAVKDLVEKITDVEPYEPYWEYIRKLELRDKGLIALHILGDFCPRIEELDLSSNELGHLKGVPSSLRLLNVRGNCLSSLTAWGHLYNLQYIDVSNNQIQHLRALSVLTHLRELKADDNRIDSLNGIFGLKGLLKLRLRRNRVQHLDFQGCDLQRLAEVDLQENKIKDVSNWHHVPSLVSINLRDNDIKTLEFSFPMSRISLSTIDLSRNNIVTLNVTLLTSLRHLNLDHNRIASIGSIQSLKDLETLTWRRQVLNDGEDHDGVDYNLCVEARSLALSGNRISTFSPRTPFLNLQRLELASAGLEELSEDFGIRMPNLRVLNINHNAIKDLRPLLGTVKLTELHVAGNRISRLRRTVAVLAKIGKYLQVVDCRQNPLTLGFYSPSVRSENTENRLIVQAKRGNHILGQEEEREEEQDRVAAWEYAIPLAERHADKRYREMLDEDTLLRRKVYELLLLGGCRELDHLDGLRVSRNHTVTKDEVWIRLMELGVIKEKS